MCNTRLIQGIVHVFSVLVVGCSLGRPPASRAFVALRIEGITQSLIQCAIIPRVYNRLFRTVETTDRSGESTSK